MTEETASGRLDPARWVDDHGDALFRYALARIGDRDTAEELVQEALLAALGARDRFTGQSSERTWLIGILKHKMIDHLRRPSQEQAASGLDSLETQSEDVFDRRGVWRQYPRRWRGRPEQTLEDEEFWVVFQRCFSGLPRRLAEVFALRELDEMATESICDVLSVSATNLWTLLYRARLRLRRCLEVHWFERVKGR